MLRWARQQLNVDALDEIGSLIVKSYPDESSIADAIQYETLLLHLYLGSRHRARKDLRHWKLRSSDPYFLVRKGALLAELGDLEAGLHACLDGIQTIRRSQNAAPESAKLLSEEAWACLIASNIQIAKKGWRVDQNDADDDGSWSTKSLGSRLADLATRGFDVRAEHQKIIAELNAEAAVPAQSHFKAGEFDLGHIASIQRFGWPVDLTNKVQAAFSWLELADTVGLVPRVDMVSFDLGAYTQAAWWAQYADSMQRMLSVAVRTLSKEVFKPKDDSVPRHKTGWFSRFQISRMPLQLASEMAERSLGEVEAALNSAIPNEELERVCTFHIEIFSRLILRLTDVEKITVFAKQIIALHSDNGRLNATGGLWKPFANALARCFEALPAEAQLVLIPLVVNIPVMPSMTVHRPFVGDWLQPIALTWWLSRNDKNRLLKPSCCDSLIEGLLQQLRDDTGLESTDASSVKIWERLVWLNDLGFISESHRVEIAHLLWNGATRWPSMPGFSPYATTLWPAPEGTQSAERFRQWVISNDLPPLGQQSNDVKTGKTTRSWTFPVNNIFLTAWLDSLRMGEWPVQELQSAIDKICNWWKLEGGALLEDVRTREHVRAALLDRLDLTDRILNEIFGRHPPKSCPTCR